MPKKKTETYSEAIDRLEKIVAHHRLLYRQIDES